MDEEAQCRGTGMGGLWREAGIVLRRRKIGNHKWNAAVPGILAAFSTCFMLFVYAPLELYMTNQAEFWFDFGQISRAALENFLLFFAANLLLVVTAALLHPALCRVLTAMETVVLLSSYVQGNFLVGNMPPFDGTEIHWEDYRGENIKTLAVWAAASVLVAVLHRLLGVERMDLVNKLLCAGMALMLFITLVTLGVSSKAYRQRTTYYALEEGQYVLSKDQNFFILLLDAVDSRNFGEVLASDPAYEEVFADFTYYPDMVGAYPWTAFATPYILSGKWYEGEEYYLDYTAAAVEESPLLRELAKRDYDIALYECDKWVTSYTYQFSNMTELHHEVYVWKYFRHAVCKLGGIRYAPFFLKEYCYKAAAQTDGQHHAFVEEGQSLYTWDMGDFVEHAREEEATFREGGCFKYYHLQGGHVPYNYDKDLNPAADATHQDMLHASIRVIDVFLQKLKEAGVYDNSVIIIMSDHGFDPENEISPYGRQNPIFFVKGLGEEHPLQTSLAPVSYEDLQEAYVRLLDGAPGDALFPWQEGQQRDRRYIYYENTNHIMYELIYTGAAWDRAAYRETGATYPRRN